MRPKQTIQQFDRFLEAGGRTFEAILVGGAALSLLGVIDRETRDCDVVHPDIPNEITEAAMEFARDMKGRGIPLQDDWLNSNPAQLADLLPDGWLTRIRLVFEGQALRLHVLGRNDLLLTKLFALCDRGTDLSDCIALKPSDRELRAALPWLEVQDANLQWPSHVREVIADLGRRLGHGV